MQAAQLEAPLSEASDTELTPFMDTKSPDVVQRCRNMLMTSGDQLVAHE